MTAIDENNFHFEVSTILSGLAKQIGKPLLVQVVAADNSGLIGIDNDIPWIGKWKTDLYFFRNLTLNQSVVMGFKTMLSLPSVLPQRKSYLLTDRPVGNLGKDDKGRTYLSRVEQVIDSLDKFKILCTDSGHKFGFIIGGGKIYNDTLEQCDAVVINRLKSDEEVNDGKGIYYPYQGLKAKKKLIKSIDLKDPLMGEFVCEIWVNV